MNGDLIVENEELDGREDKAKLKKLQEALLQRCKAAGIEAEMKEDIGDETYVRVGYPNGRDKRWRPFRYIESFEAILDSDFEKYVFLGNFMAIANYSENYIEAIIRPIRNIPRHYVYKRIFGESEIDGEVPSLKLEQEFSSRKIIIEIGETSQIMQILERGTYARRGLSIKISGVNISQHNKSLEILKKISNSLFFQLDMQDRIAFSLVRDRRNPRRPSHMLKRSSEIAIDLEFPKIEFDEGPCSLYWYARSALNMPLLQFLAFYQVIEYYYPTYSQREAQQRIRAILKDPTFRTEKDSDIGKILSTISGRGRGFGTELSQLRATMNSCLDAKELWAFLTEYEERKEFFSAKQKGLTDLKLSIGNKEIDLRSAVAELIYDIRCKIVHTKGENSDGEIDLLLPFSKEADLLFFDIELLQYVARKVMIAASAPLKL